MTPEAQGTGARPLSSFLVVLQPDVTVEEFLEDLLEEQIYAYAETDRDRVSSCYAGRFRVESPSRCWSGGVRDGAVESTTCRRGTTLPSMTLMVATSS